jgi:hypothetical protein
MEKLVAVLVVAVPLGLALLVLLALVVLIVLVVWLLVRRPRQTDKLPWE